MDTRYRLLYDQNEEEEGNEDEFVGAGAGTGIYRFPVMERFPSDRPPCMEVRLVPISKKSKEDERTLVFAVLDLQPEQQLWLGLPSELRVWSFESLWNCSGNNPPRHRGGVWEDEDTPCFSSSVPTSHVSCLLPDPASRVMWSGHADGRISAWPSSVSENQSAFQALLTWRAHKGPVLSMVMTSYGELWTSSENGVLRAWPWEVTDKALAVATKDFHSAVSKIQRSYVDLRSRGATPGSSTFLNYDIRFLHSNHSTGEVWGCGFHFLELWDARNRIILKVFGTNANCDLGAPEISIAKDFSKEEKTGADKRAYKKEQRCKHLKHFQRRKSIFKDAADAVWRVGGQEHIPRLEVLALSADQSIWSAYSNGLLVNYDNKVNRIQEFMHMPSSIKCLCCLGPRLWIGYSDGRVHILEQDGKPLGGWLAHASAVIDIAVGGGFVFTLAADGSIRGWNMMSPGPLDPMLRSALIENEGPLTRNRHLNIFSATWNVGRKKASYDSLILWLASPASEASIVVIGLQEMEMGPGFLAMAAAKESVGIEGSANGQWWLEKIGEVLDEGTTFQRIASRQLAGLLIGIWIRKELQPFIGELESGAVACGFGHTIGNKGAVGLKMKIFRRTLCVINCHFAAHMGAVSRRNADFEYVYRHMTFSHVTTGACGSSSCIQKLRNPDEQQATELDTDDKKTTAMKIVPEEFLPQLSQVDMLIWLGDFNYRLDHISYEKAKECIEYRDLNILLEKDQLRKEMAAGRVFAGMREAKITFPPTYKFDSGERAPQAYDSSEKRRVPAWCDRIVFRDSRNDIYTACKMSCPVVACCTCYDACMDVNDSDHKPVRCMLNVEIASVNESFLRRKMRMIMHQERQIFSQIALSNSISAAVISAKSITLRDTGTTAFRVTNISGQHVLMFEVCCGGEAFVGIGQRFDSSKSTVRGCFGFPRWLQVIPASGFIHPGMTIEVAVNHEDFFTDEEYMNGIAKSAWCEDERSKQVMLLLNVKSWNSHEGSQQQILLSHEKVSNFQIQNQNSFARNQRKILQRASSVISFKHVGSPR